MSGDEPRRSEQEDQSPPSEDDQSGRDQSPPNASQQGRRDQSFQSQPQQGHSARGQPQQGQSARGQPQQGQSARGQPQQGQSARGQPQQGQSQRARQPQQGQSQRARQPAGRHPGAGGSVTDILYTDSGKRFLLYIIGTFSAVGFGYGVGLMLLSATGGLGGEVFGAAALVLAVLAAPVISMVTGVLTGLRLGANDWESVLVSGLGAFLGFFAMLIIMIIFAALVFSNGGDDGGGGGGFGPLFAFSAGVAISGAATTYVLKRFGI
jgi:hypothetical protein